jgi:hypothetical protein
MRRASCGFNKIEFLDITPFRRMPVSERPLVGPEHRATFAFDNLAHGKTIQAAIYPSVH